MVCMCERAWVWMHTRVCDAWCAPSLACGTFAEWGGVCRCPSLLRSSSADRVSIEWGQVGSKSGHCFPCPFPFTLPSATPEPWPLKADSDIAHLLRSLEKSPIAGRVSFLSSGCPPGSLRWPLLVPAEGSGTLIESPSPGSSSE